MDQRVAVRTESAQLRADAVRLRLEVAQSREQVMATMRAALRVTETIFSRLERAVVCGSDRRPSARDSMLEQLEARLASLPVIEQAKGVIMAQQGCGADEAFDILRRASQRKNQKLRDLAEGIVAAHQV